MLHLYPDNYVSGSFVIIKIHEEVKYVILLNMFW